MFDESNDAGSKVASLSVCCAGGLKSRLKNGDIVFLPLLLSKQP